MLKACAQCQQDAVVLKFVFHRVYPDVLRSVEVIILLVFGIYIGQVEIKILVFEADPS